VPEREGVPMVPEFALALKTAVRSDPAWDGVDKVAEN
jgi:hypothetical protein